MELLIKHIQELTVLPCMHLLDSWKLGGCWDIDRGQILRNWVSALRDQVLNLSCSLSSDQPCWKILASGFVIVEANVKCYLNLNFLYLALVWFCWFEIRILYLPVHNELLNKDHTAFTEQRYNVLAESKTKLLVSSVLTNLFIDS